MAFKLAAVAALAEADDPVRKVAHVDELDASSGGAGARTSPPRATRCGQ